MKNVLNFIQRKQLPLAIFFLFLATLIAYGNSLNSGFLLDDQILIVENQNLHNFTNFKFMLGPFLNYFRPMTFLSFKIDYLLWGLWPQGYHLTNIILHFFNGVLIFLLIRAVWNNLYIAFASSLLFVVHPIHNIPINYITDRGNLLAGFFMLSSLLVIFSDRIKTILPKTTAAVALFICALLSRESAALFPVYVLLLYFSKKKTIKKQKILIIFSSISAVLLIYLIWRKMFFDFSYIVIPKQLLFITKEKIAALCLMFITYLNNLLWPDTPLIIKPLSNIAEYNLWPSIIVVLMLTFFVTNRKCDKKIAVASVVWFILGIGSLYGFMFSRLSTTKDFFLQDNQIYFTSIGFFVFLGLFFWVIKNTIKLFFSIGLLFLAFIFYAFASIGYNSNYYSHEGFFRNQLKNTPSCSIASFHLAKILSKTNEPAAKKIYRYSITHTANDSEVYVNIGNMYLEKNRFADAEKFYAKAIECSPALWLPWHNLGVIAFKKNDLPQAEKYFLKASQLSPDSPQPYQMLIMLYQRQNRIQDAIKMAAGLWNRFPQEESWGILLIKLYLVDNQDEKALQAIGRLSKMTGKRPNEIINNIYSGLI